MASHLNYRADVCHQSILQYSNSITHRIFICLVYNFNYRLDYNLKEYLKKLLIVSILIE